MVTTSTAPAVPERLQLLLLIIYVELELPTMPVLEVNNLIVISFIVDNGSLLMESLMIFGPP